MKQLNQAVFIAILATLFCGLSGWTLATEMETTPHGVAKTLTELNTWILVQPKALASLPNEQPRTTSDLAEGASTVSEFAEKNVHWLGHDTFKLVGQKTVYIDPFKIQTSDKADIICITHAHFDHCAPEDIAKVRGDTTVVVATEDCAKKIPGKVQLIKPGEKLHIGGVEIEAVPAYNTNKEFHPKANGWVGYIITLDKIRIYHAGDTDYIPEMKDIRADVTLLPVSGTYVMTADEAVQAALDIRPQVAIPMHYGSIVGKPSDAQRFQDLLKGKVKVIVKSRE